MQEEIFTHIVYYSNHDCHSLNTDLEMRIILHTNKDLEHFEKVFSIEHILISIKKLEDQLKVLESKQPYQIFTSSPI